MVEGPQCRMFKDRISRIWGQRLRHIIKAPRELCATLQWLIDRRLVRIFNVGKELFLIFEHPRDNGAEGNDVLRVHFGICGFARVTNAGVELSSHREPFVVLEFEKWRIHFRAKVNVVQHTYALSVEHRLPRDVNSEHFDYKSVISRLRRHRGIVADAIMDQSVIPGVGNVIKCEAMFTAKVHPLRRVKTLSTSKLRHLIDELRWFANWWYENPMCDPDLRASGNSKVYGYDICTACSSRVALIKKGRTSLPRLTYYCPVCQADDVVRDQLSEVLSRTPGLDNANNTELRVQPPTCKCGSVTVLYASHRVVAGGSNAQDRVDMQLKRVAHRAAACVEERPACVASADFGRLRFLCQHGFKGGCGHESWADAQLPQCECGNGRHAALGRVVSMNENNGRYFATCGMSYDRGARCNFFRWVSMPLLVAWHQLPNCHTADRRTSEGPVAITVEPCDSNYPGKGVINAEKPVRRWPAVTASHDAPQRWCCINPAPRDSSLQNLASTSIEVADGYESLSDIRSTTGSIPDAQRPPASRRWSRSCSTSILYS